MRALESNSIDAIVTDPPYGLAFMGKKWDYSVPSKEIWIEALRVLKPGGHLLSFGGTRTYHRMVVNIEDAGFEIRDQIQWLYGSGFPKSHNIGKSIDKAAGAKREVIGTKEEHNIKGSGENSRLQTSSGKRESITLNITAPATDLAKQWDGWGTALKPANEPICLARKPLEGTVAQNIERWGVCGINIDGCRIEGKPRTTHAAGNFRTQDNETGIFGGGFGIRQNPSPQGRWPANLLLDETAAEMLDAQSWILKNGGQNKTSIKGVGMFMNGSKDSGSSNFAGASGGASRFFYVAKASRGERNAGLEGEYKQKQGARPKSADASGKFPDHDHRETGGNNHPTVKPIKLMEYLCKLITPPGGTILDPFMGSGTTGVAAQNLGFKFVGVEMNEEYFEIAKRRVCGE